MKKIKVWAFAKLEIGEAALTKAVSSWAQERLGQFTIQELTNTVWAFAMVDRLDVLLF